MNGGGTGVSPVQPGGDVRHSTREVVFEHQNEYFNEN
jgi:hypothetical protein